MILNLNHQILSRILMPINKTKLIVNITRVNGIKFTTPLDILLIITTELKYNIIYQLISLFLLHNYNIVHTYNCQHVYKHIYKKRRKK